MEENCRHTHTHTYTHSTDLHWYLCHSYFGDSTAALIMTKSCWVITCNAAQQHPNQIAYIYILYGDGDIAMLLMPTIEQERREWHETLETLDTSACVCLLCGEYITILCICACIYGGCPLLVHGWYLTAPRSPYHMLRKSNWCSGSETHSLKHGWQPEIHAHSTRTQ